MRKITVTLKDPVADWARMEAARRHISVSELVGEVLTEKMERDDAYGRAMNDWLQRDAHYRSDGAPCRRLGREHVHLLLIDDARRGLDDITAGRTFEADAAIARLQQRRADAERAGAQGHAAATTGKTAKVPKELD